MRAKVNVKSAARKAGAPVPPMAPKPKQIGAQAKGRAKGAMKRFVVLGIILLSAAIIAGIVYLVKYHGKQPKDALKKAFTYAYENKYEAFRESFTADSISLLETTWDRAGDPWEHMMDGVTPPTKPKILGESVKEVKGFKTAQVEVLLEDNERTVHMREEDGKWKININVAINPRKISLPEGLDPAILEMFSTDDEYAAWWEEEEEEGADGEKPKSSATKNKILRKIGCSRFAR
ncbi:MAG: hypothetical protein WC966_09205 [Bradymonadales bacterium]|jgi:hypothetical protein